MERKSNERALVLVRHAASSAGSGWTQSGFEHLTGFLCLLWVSRRSLLLIGSFEQTSECGCRASLHWWRTTLVRQLISGMRQKNI